MCLISFAAAAAAVVLIAFDSHLLNIASENVYRVCGDVYMSQCVLHHNLMTTEKDIRKKFNKLMFMFIHLDVNV